MASDTGAGQSVLHSPAGDSAVALADHPMLGKHERDQTTHRVPRHVWPIQAEVREELLEHDHRSVQLVG